MSLSIFFPIFRAIFITTAFFSILVFSTFSLFAQKSIEEIRQDQENLHINLADSLHKEHREQEAYSQYSQFVELYPFSVKRFYALDKMAKIEEDRQDFSAALAIYQTLYSENLLTQKGVEYLFQISRLYEKIGEYEKAKKSYLQIIEHYPNSIYAQNARSALQLWDMLPLD